MQIKEVRIYKYGTAWCYAADDEDGFDHSDEIGCPDDASETEARAEVTRAFPGAHIVRVEDLSEE